MKRGRKKKIKGKERKEKGRKGKKRKEKKRRKICSENRITIKMKITSAHDGRNSMKKKFDLILPYENGS